MSIRIKILGAFLIASLLGVLLGVTGVVSASMAVVKMRELRSAIILSHSYSDVLNDHQGWWNDLSTSVLTGDEFTGTLDHSACVLGQWLNSEEAASISDPNTKSMLSNVSSSHVIMHNEAANIVKLLRDGDKEGAAKLLTGNVMPAFDIVISNLVTMNNQINDHTRDLEEETYVIANMAIRMIYVLIAIVLAASVFLAMKIANTVSKPLAILSSFMKHASTTGDISIRSEDSEVIQRYAYEKDEIGLTISSFASFMQHITETSKLLSEMAEGDLTHDVKLLSDKDTMGMSLHSLFVNLNKMFGEIHGSAVQVNDGARQMADGAQALAQGSTEQAASIQELSSSISEIAEKTKANANMAEKASLLADTIKGNAEKGNRQMGEMMEAVHEINEASGSIGKVIKVIDDIAFQTNILALNAAVEAARAGQHGKGFAVVAEEVRNLAAKSAEAAKDTGSLIDNSIEKASLGARIANDTAESLTEIVSGIQESSELVGEIARSSEEQSVSINQINSGIDQVARVVQHNSATAQEEAAASQEMSSQSSMLQDLIGQFKLANNDTRLPHTQKSSMNIQMPGRASKRLVKPVDDGNLAFPMNSGDFGKF